MKKPLVKGISSESYSTGRIDSFRIEIIGGTVEGTEKQLIFLLKDLGFNSKEVDDKLLATLGEEDYLFLYANEKIKAHIFVDSEKDFLILRFDTSLSRIKINSSIEKHFDLSLSKKK
ncbi:MAG: hypothetical protein K0B11_16850 [Mariniphaga sp.]|nr:hypothetical protein [Mariniphaga sp.]